MERFKPEKLVSKVEEQKELKELEKIKNEVVLIDPRNPDYKGVGIGIEITTPGFEGLNLDHHGKECNSDTPSAIEQAFSVDVSKIPEGKIATVRPDLDSVGAIACLMLRKEGILPDEKLIKAIGFLDRKGPAVFKKEGKEFLEVSDEDFEKISKILSAVRYKIVSQRTPLPEAILFMKKVLTGKVEEKEIESLYSKDQKELEEAKKASKVEIVCNGKVALVESAHLRAFEIGYEQADIVIAYNPNFKWPSGEITPKFTIARRDSNVKEIDLSGLAEELNKIVKERGVKGTWGGRENILGSPQNEDPKISVDELVQIIEKHLK